MSGSLSSAEIVVLLEGDISDVDDPDLQDDVEEETFRAAVRERFSDEGAPAGETLNIERYGVPVEVQMRNDNDEGDTPLSVKLGSKNQGELPIHEINQCWRHKNMEATYVT
jgi:hypothetical protein